MAEYIKVSHCENRVSLCSFWPVASFFLLYIVHLAGGLLVLVLAEASYGGHVVVVFSLGSGLVGGVLVGILLNVLCFCG